jgi:hypothetical protein
MYLADVPIYEETELRIDSQQSVLDLLLFLKGRRRRLGCVKHLFCAV